MRVGAGEGEGEGEGEGAGEVRVRVGVRYQVPSVSSSEHRVWASFRFTIAR